VTKGGNRASFKINVIKNLTNTRSKGHGDVRLCTALSMFPI